MILRPNYRGNQGFNLGPVGFIIISNLILFLATMVRQSLFFNFFGLSASSLLSQPWTIVTNLFIHASFGHIFANMLTLYFYGTYLINLVGEKKFFLIYFLGGILGNIAFLLLAPSYATAIGASGAVFAVGGALAALRPKLPVMIFPIPVTLPLWVVVIGGFFIMTAPGIAWQAHLGGLLLGLAAGYYFKRNVRGYY